MNQQKRPRNYWDDGSHGKALYKYVQGFKGQYTHLKGINREFQQRKKNYKKGVDGNYRTEKYNIQNQLLIEYYY